MNNYLFVSLICLLNVLYTHSELIRIPTLSHSLGNIFDTIGQFQENPQNVISNPKVFDTIKNLHKVELKPERFNDVYLEHQLPQYFLLNEVFQIKGKVNQTKLNSYFRTQPRNATTYKVNVVFLSQEDGKQYIFSSKDLQKDELEFYVQCYFDHPDTYFMGIFIGDQAQFTPRIFEVRHSVDGEQYVSQIQSQDYPPKPQNISLQVQDNEMIVRWAPISPLSKLIFSQQYPRQINREFLISNDQGYLIIPYVAFKDFNASQTEVALQYAWSADIGAYSRNSRFSQPYRQIFNVTEHHFRVFRPDLLKLNHVPSMVQLKTKLELKGQSNQKMRQQIFVVQPDNKIIQKVAQSNGQTGRYIAPNQQFQFSEEINEQGVYFIQINHEKGWALLNTPIYAGNRFPLLPDYNDLYPYMKKGSVFEHLSINSQSSSSANLKNDKTTLDQKRQLILQLINQKRKQFNQQPVIIDQELNQVAQSHSQDMARNNYASHTNLRGQSANDRSLQAGIFTPVGQAIAVNEDLQFGQYRLGRSPIHLKNIINPQWDRVGVGIAQNQRGLYYITENFSLRDPLTDKITQQQMGGYKQQLLTALNQKSDKNIKQDKDFSRDLYNWHETDWNDTDALKILMAKHRAYRVSYQKVSLAFTDKFISLLQQKDYLRDRGFSNVALSLRIVQRTFQIAMVFF